MKKLLFTLTIISCIISSYASSNKHHHRHHRHHHHKYSATTNKPVTVNTPMLTSTASSPGHNSPQSQNLTSSATKLIASTAPAKLTPGEILAGKSASSQSINNQSTSSTTSFNEQEVPTYIAHQPRLYSYSALAVNANNGNIIVSKNSNVRLPIASISKLMTAMVTLDSGVNLDSYVTISALDVDHLKNTTSRLRVGARYKRRDLLLLALMSSENRAAHALARTSYPGGINTFISKMNAKAASLGMAHTRFYDPTGLNNQNQSTAADLSKMVKAAFNYSAIKQDTTTKGSDFALSPSYVHHYINSDVLVRLGKFPVSLSKTGFINEAGHCLVLYSIIDNTPVIMVFLNSSGKSGRILDAITVRNYVKKIS